MINSRKTVAKEKKWIAGLGVLFLAAVFLLFCKKNAFAATDDEGQDEFYKWKYITDVSGLPHTDSMTDYDVHSDDFWYPVMFIYGDDGEGQALCYTTSSPTFTDWETRYSESEFSSIDWERSSYISAETKATQVSVSCTTAVHAQEFSKIYFPRDEIKAGKGEYLSMDTYGAVFVKYAGTDGLGPSSKDIAEGRATEAQARDHYRYWIRVNENGKPGKLLCTGVCHVPMFIGSLDYSFTSAHVALIDHQYFNIGSKSHLGDLNYSSWNAKMDSKTTETPFVEGLATWRFVAAGSKIYIRSGANYYPKTKVVDGVFMGDGNPAELETLQRTSLWAGRRKDKNGSEMLFYKDGGDQFSMYIGNPFSIARYNSNSTVKDGAINNIGTDGGYALLDIGKKISVQKGGTLMVRGTFICAGDVEVNGGSVVLTPGSTMIMLHADNSNPYRPTLDILNQGEVIIPPGAGLFVTSNKDLRVEDIYLTTGGRIQNGGLLMVDRNGVYMGPQSYIYNDGATYLGYVPMDENLSGFEYLKGDSNRHNSALNKNFDKFIKTTQALSKKSPTLTESDLKQAVKDGETLGTLSMQINSSIENMNQNFHLCKYNVSLDYKKRCIVFGKYAITTHSINNASDLDSITKASTMQRPVFKN